MTVSFFLLCLQYDQFARAVGDAAIKQQVDLRDALRMLSDSVSLQAQTQGKYQLGDGSNMSIMYYG